MAVMSKAPHPNAAKLFRQLGAFPRGTDGLAKICGGEFAANGYTEERSCP